MKHHFLFKIAILISITTPVSSHYQLTDAMRKRLSPYSLNRYAWNKYSQFGEDGIINEIFRRLKIKHGFFVEFGAHNGIFASNTRHLWQQGWSGAMIEADDHHFKQLLQNYSNTANIKFIHQFVTWNEQDSRGLTFDTIQNIYFPAQDIDFLSIDIDGGDYYILKGLQARPKVICIENNLYWHPLLDTEVPENIALKNLHQPLICLINLARSLGYEPVCLTINLFLVRRDLYEPFKDVPSDSISLWRDAFRAFPEKQAIIYRRTIDSDIHAIEGNHFEEACPITEHF